MVLRKPKNKIPNTFGQLQIKITGSITLKTITVTFSRKHKALNQRSQRDLGTNQTKELSMSEK